jgi:hypothetical protein
MFTAGMNEKFVKYIAEIWSPGRDKTFTQRLAVLKFSFNFPVWFGLHTVEISHFLACSKYEKMLMQKLNFEITVIALEFDITVT